MDPAASQPAPFKLERYFAQYEFNTKYMLSCSDPEPMSMTELLSMADQECRDMWQNLSLGYTESTGHPLLKHEIAKLHGVTSEESLVVVPQEGIYMAMKVLTDVCKRSHPDEEIHAIVTYPGYQSLYENLNTLGCKVSKWTAKMEGERGWSFDLTDLRQLLTNKTHILVVNFPHNPTSFVPDSTTWQEIMSICQERNMYLFSDEMYRLTDNAPLPDVYPSACSLYDNSISLFGLSKSFGLPGVRLGWLCTRSTDLMAGLASFKDYLTICSSAPSEILAIIALRNKDKLLDRTMQTIHRNLPLLDTFFSKYRRYFLWVKPVACTTTFVELLPPLLDRFGGSAESFCAHCRAQCDVLLVPAAMYDVTDKYVRLGFGRRNLPEALAALENFLNKNNITAE